MAHLFATTDLEKSYRVNMNMIGLDNKPAVKGLVEILSEWLTFRRSTVTCRLQYRLDKVVARLHILQGLMIAFLNIDEVIHLIRNEDKPKAELMARFGLSEEQADAILNLRLRQLAKLEETALKAESDELEKERLSLEQILGSERRLNTLVKKEIQADAKAFASPRRSPMVERSDAKAINEAEMLPAEPVTVVLSNMGWVRCAKGHDIDARNLSYKAGDAYQAHACGKSNQPALFVDSTGRSYGVEPLSLPSARSQGEPLTGKLNLPVGAKVLEVKMGEEEQPLLLASDAGYGFVCPLSELNTRNKGGKALLNLPENAQVLPIQTLDERHNLLVAISQAGRMLVFPLEQLPVLSKVNRSKGNKIINISAADAKAGTDRLAKLLVINEQDGLVFQAGKRKITLKAKDLQKYRAERGRKGTSLPRGVRFDTPVDILQAE